MFDDFTRLVSDASEWAYAIVFLFAFLDALVPVVPSESAVITAGVVAAAGDLSLPVVIGGAACGAFLGDNTAYYIGSKLSGFIARQAARREKWQGRLDWAAQQIRLRGGVLLITARFIPGGRSVLTISSGITRQPKAWFMGWIALAAAIWATYAAGLGYFGGKTFEDDHTKAFIVAFSAALGMTLVVEVVRHFRARNKPKVDLEVGS